MIIITLVDLRSTTITEKGQISIPRELREQKGFEVGSKLAIFSFEDRIELRPMKNFNEKMYCALMSEKSLAKDWLSEEDEKAWAYLQKKNTKKVKY